MPMGSNYRSRFEPPTPDPDQKVQKTEWIDPEDSECLTQQAFREERKRNPHASIVGVLISCPCKRCNPHTLSI